MPTTVTKEDYEYVEDAEYSGTVMLKSTEAPSVCTRKQFMNCTQRAYRPVPTMTEHEEQQTKINSSAVTPPRALYVASRLSSDPVRERE